MGMFSAQPRTCIGKLKRFNRYVYTIDSGGFTVHPGVI